jgi:hypothetical protein
MCLQRAAAINRWTDALIRTASAHLKGNAPMRGSYDEVCQVLREFGRLHVIAVAAEGNIPPSGIRGSCVRLSKPSRAGIVSLTPSGERLRAWMGIIPVLRTRIALSAR